MEPTQQLTAQELVARNVRRVRAERDRTQAQLARQLGWTKSTLSKLEGGIRGVGVDDLLALALALEVVPAVLLIPWEDDEELAVSLRGGERTVIFDSADAFGWIIGAPDRSLVLHANPANYFWTTPAAVRGRYGDEWLRRMREELGWEISNDGRHVRVPGGISVHRGEGER
jgi:transcriptional regulator with XRE-family HTH domain